MRMPYFFFNFYNGVAVGIRADTVYEASKLGTEEADIKTRTAWVFILPLFEITIIW